MDQQGVRGPVTHTVTMECFDVDGRVGQLEAELCYVPADPYAVTVRFSSGGQTVPWTFARDLLARGRSGPAGVGDVQARPDVDRDGFAVTVLELQSQEGMFTARARTSEVGAFLARTFEAVPDGAESGQVDVDAAIAALFTV